MGKRSTYFWQIAFTYIGAIVGAGFASGQEIFKFFGIFGSKGILGALLAGLLLAFYGFQIVRTSALMRLDSYEQYLVYLFGSRKAKLMDGLIGFFLLCGFAVMLVAGGSLFNQLWGWHPAVGFILNAVILYVIMLVGVKGMLWLNTVLIPFLVVASIIVAALSLTGGSQPDVIQELKSQFLINNWLLGSLLYVSYNVVLGMVVLVTLGDIAYKGGSGGAVLGGVVLGVMAAFLALALKWNFVHVQAYDVPLLALAGLQANWLAKCYSLVLWVAIITTALGNGLGLVQRLRSNFPIPLPIVIALPFLPAIALLGWPLGRAVGLIYPLMGYLGFVLIIAISFRIFGRPKF
ncbi:MAG: hypothetical protein WAO24_01105 [Peptococcia bacterium]